MKTEFEIEVRVLSNTGACPVCGVDWGLCSHADVTENYGTYLLPACMGITYVRDEVFILHDSEERLKII